MLHSSLFTKKMKYQLDSHGEMLMEQYHERIAVYERLSHLADEALRDALDAQHVKVTAMEHRIKTETSLAGKLELKGGKYQTLDDVTDIVGLRVVTFYSADVDKVAAIVNETFVVDRRNSVDKRKQHRLDSFGYNSLHYICRLPKAIVDDPEMPLLNDLYEMPTEDYDKAIGKLADEINDPSFKAIEAVGSVFDTTSALYQEMEKNGRINFFWQIAAASLVEQLFVISQTQEQFLSPFTDETAANVTMRLGMILDAVNRLAQYDSDIEPVAQALAPLDGLKATTVAQMDEQMTSLKDKIHAARTALIK